MLEFATEQHTITKKGGTKFVIPATDLRQGTKPAGSVWRRLPVPACNCDIGVGCAATTSDTEAKGADSHMSIAYSNSPPPAGVAPKCSTGLQFEAAHLTDGVWPEGYGYYMETGDSSSTSKGSKDDPCSEHGPDQSTCEQVKECSYVTKAGKAYCYTSKKRRAEYFSRTYGEPSFTIGDELKVPTEIGEYVLSWRWDCEQTPQIWTTCADIEIRDPEDAVFSSAGAIKPRATILHSLGLALAGALWLYSMVD